MSDFRCYWTLKLFGNKQKLARVKLKIDRTILERHSKRPSRLIIYHALYRTSSIAIRSMPWRLYVNGERVTDKIGNLFPAHCCLWSV